jgi:hypothetical protein
MSRHGEQHTSSSFLTCLIGGPSMMFAPKTVLLLWGDHAWTSLICLSGKLSGLAEFFISLSAHIYRKLKNKFFLLIQPRVVLLLFPKSGK